MKKKKISVYVKSGEIGAGNYYRFSQYFKKIDNNSFSYKITIPDFFYKKYMPISKQPFYVKFLLMIFFQIRVGLQVLNDFITKPDIIIISRRPISKYIPLYIRLMYKHLQHRGTKFLYDIDDNVLESKEITKTNFDFVCDITEKIVSASPYLIDLISKENKSKILFLPTTDGDMYKRLTDDIEQIRLKIIDSEIKLIWIGTSISINFLDPISKSIEELGLYFKNINKKLTLTVVCDKPFIYTATNFNLINIKWTREISISNLLQSHIGIMPLENNSFTKGKGGFKLIQYLSIGLPVIASNVGINNEIVTSDVGECVNEFNNEEWINAIKKIVAESNDWMNYSKCARKKWDEYYSFEKNLKEWIKLIHN